MCAFQRGCNKSVSREHLRRMLIRSMYLMSNKCVKSVSREHLYVKKKCTVCKTKNKKCVLFKGGATKVCTGSFLLIFSRSFQAPGMRRPEGIDPRNASGSFSRDAQTGTKVPLEFSSDNFRRTTSKHGAGIVEHGGLA